ncbi:MAG TPA: site-specific integrase [Sphingomonas sp.]
MIDSCQPVKGRAVFLWDGELRGFGCKVEGAGTKSFVLQYRNAERRKRRLVIGRYGVVTLEQARDDARIKLGQIAKGEDPADIKQASRNGLSVGAICDWYLTEAEAGRLLGRKRQPIKASTLYMDRSRVETHIRPLLGRRPVAALILADIEKMQTDIAAGKTAKPRGEGRGRATVGGKGAASRSVTTLHSIFAHAKRHGLIESNPAAGVRKFPDQKKTRRLSRAEIAELGQALRGFELIEHPVGLAIVRLLALSGLRLNEAQGTERKWVSDEGYIAFGDTKTGAQIRIIGKPALKILRAQPVLEGSPYVFPSDGGQGHFVAADGVLGRICKHLGWDDVTAHTLRHTFGSMAGELGYSELTIAAMLGHAAGSVTSRYVHLDEAVQSAVERVSAEISRLLDGETQRVAPTGNVFSIGTPSLLVRGSSGVGLVSIRQSVATS